MLVREVAEALSAQVVGDGAIAVERIVHPSAAQGACDLAVAMTGEAFSALAGSKALAAVVAAKPAAAQHTLTREDKLKAMIVAPQGRDTLAALTALFDKGPTRLPGVHPSAVVDPSATIGNNVSIGPLTVIGARSRIGDNAVILSQVTIGADVTIGEGALIHPGVRIGDRVRTGTRLRVHANAVIGADGFSFGLSPDKGGKFSADVTIKRIHSLGAVVIGDDVEIGACATIDRATLDTTRIGNGTKIDNLVQIAHNVTVGENCLICGMAGLSGSVVVGDRVRIGGGAGVADHLRLGSESTVAAGSGVGTNVAEGTVVSGYPAMRHDRSTEYFIYLGRQKALHKKVDDMHARIEALEQQTKRQPTRAS